MDRTGLWLLLVSILYIWTGQKVSGKCSGQWAIHACGGGNGKRSDGEMGALGDREKESRISLQRILRGFGEYSNEDDDTSSRFGEPDLSNYVDDVLSQQPDLAYIQKENRKQQSLLRKLHTEKIFLASMKMKLPHVPPEPGQLEEMHDKYTRLNLPPGQRLGAYMTATKRFSCSQKQAIVLFEQAKKDVRQALAESQKEARIKLIYQDANSLCEVYDKVSDKSAAAVLKETSKAWTLAEKKHKLDFQQLQEFESLILDIIYFAAKTVLIRGKQDQNSCKRLIRKKDVVFLRLSAMNSDLYEHCQKLTKAMNTSLALLLDEPAARKTSSNGSELKKIVIDKEQAGGNDRKFSRNLLADMVPGIEEPKMTKVISRTRLNSKSSMIPSKELPRTTATELLQILEEDNEVYQNMNQTFETEIRKLEEEQDKERTNQARDAADALNARSEKMEFVKTVVDIHSDRHASTGSI